MFVLFQPNATQTAMVPRNRFRMGSIRMPDALPKWGLSTPGGFWYSDQRRTADRVDATDLKSGDYRWVALLESTRNLVTCAHRSCVVSMARRWLFFRFRKLSVAFVPTCSVSCPDVRCDADCSLL